MTQFISFTNQNHNKGPPLVLNYKDLWKKKGHPFG